MNISIRGELTIFWWNVISIRGTNKYIILKIAFGIIVSSSDNYGHEWDILITTLNFNHFIVFKTMPCLGSFVFLQFTIYNFLHHWFHVRMQFCLFVRSCCLLMWCYPWPGQSLTLYNNNLHFQPGSWVKLGPELKVNHPTAVREPSWSGRCPVEV